jgi:hypothetical protein
MKATKDLREYSRCYSRNSKQTPPTYMLRAPPLCQTVENIPLLHRYAPVNMMRTSTFTLFTQIEQSFLPDVRVLKMNILDRFVLVTGHS